MPCEDCIGCHNARILRQPITPELLATLGQFIPLSIAQPQFHALLVQLFFEYLVCLRCAVVAWLLGTAFKYMITSCCLRFSQPANVAKKMVICVFKALFSNFRKSLASRTVPKVEPLTADGAGVVSIIYMVYQASRVT